MLTETLLRQLLRITQYVKKSTFFRVANRGGGYTADKTGRAKKRVELLKSRDII